jgi:hypothetical protein
MLPAKQPAEIEPGLGPLRIQSSGAAKRRLGLRRSSLVVLHDAEIQPCFVALGIELYGSL